MSDGITLDYSRFEAAAGKLGSIVEVDGEVFMRTQAKGVISEVIKITPPANGAGSTIKASVERAGAKIDRDLRALFIPVQIKGARTINHLFGDFNPDGVGRQPPYVVPTREVYPDVEGIYGHRKQRGSATGRKTVGRGRRQAYYVAAAKMEALARKLKARIGWLAAGWNAAANALKAAMPAYAKRHNAPGDFQVEVSDKRIRITFTNDVSYAARVPGIQRRLQFALDKQAGKMERQIPHVLKAAAEKSGFKAAA